MAKFKFQKSSIDIEIEDHVFTVDASNEGLINKSKDLGVHAVELGQKMEALKEGKDIEAIEAAVQEIINFCANAIDELLGDGSYNKIFEGRKKNFMEHLDCWGYIMSELNKATMEYADNVAEKYSPNRAARRGKRK